MGPRVAPLFAVSLLLFALAAGARAGEPKVYRWVGEDGHVYVTSTPPPNGAGEIGPAASSARPAAQEETSSVLDSFLGWLRGFWGAFMRWLWGADGPPVREGRVRVDREVDCSRWSGVISQWRSARMSVEAAEQRLDQIQSRTDNFMSRDETAYTDSVDQATEAIEQARDRVSSAEDAGQRAGMPQSCLTE